MRKFVTGLKLVMAALRFPTDAVDEMLMPR
jgi:hypothetical protein